MKLSNTAEYSLRILSFMAKDPEHLYSAKYLVESLNISDKYLRRLMTTLSKHGFIRSVQGRDGGYVFAKPLKDISFADIIEAIDGMDKYTGCVLGFRECSDENACVMHETWVKIKQRFVEVFENSNLAGLNFENVYKV